MPNWLVELLTEAAAKKWCNWIGCTTCGAYDLRSALARKLCARAGVEYPDAQIAGRPVLWDLGREDFSRITDVALADLATVRMADLTMFNASRRDFDMGMIFSELEVRFALRSRLQDSELAAHYGAMYEEELAAAATRAEAAARNRAADQAAALGRRAERDKAATEHVERGKALCARRLEVIADLRAMSAEERLTAIAENRFGLALDAIPFELLKCDSAVIAGAEPSTRRALANRIDRREGPYRMLRTALLDGLS